MKGKPLRTFCFCTSIYEEAPHEGGRDRGRTVQSYVYKATSPVYPISFYVFHDEDKTVVLYNSRRIISHLIPIRVA